MHCIELKIILDKPSFYNQLEWNAVKDSIHSLQKMKNISEQKRGEKPFDD